MKGKKVLNASINSDDKDKKIEEELSEFCFMAIEDAEDEDKDELQRAFKDYYRDSIMLAKKKKELKDMMEVMANENKELKDKVASIRDLGQTTSINEQGSQGRTQRQEKRDAQTTHGFQKLSNMLHH